MPMRDTVQRREVLKIFGLGGLAAALGPVVSACSPSGASGGSTAGSAAPTAAPAASGNAGGGGGTKEIGFWWNPSVESSDAMVKWMNTTITAFQAANPGVHVESVTQPPEQMVGNFR